ncbi:lytic transglycosylase domain-containing protein [Mameliella sediminis]|uniref:lytic transglycosylase domain-containing protein n=1 Tax=Mameliella sediminis TaxID=2836866 RepID=UPI001C4566EF|nr:lytic transglycosylase domain-containing protein [Mameliella sediminis]MBY6115015.1 lytic transglycosylase domain-containing protein [Antarctobacter heliothermus]MBY6145100.1 lytic transglycosylase domain-containing protein [Mameliella alba]MBV7396207.1 lytic transglycosylase domain-containing protein [Mameliella sediminis]MBY6160617.1 lytic transglycosylase domain-containing protein [Mameliella alba]MBY6169087.1 lytic transglycosylase domain-containing protein [Mameliella alba]
MLARRLFLISAVALVAACSTGPRDPVAAEPVHRAIPLHPNETPELRSKINKWADHYDLPRGLVHRLAIRESTHNPAARAGPYWGLLQILPQTARTMGFQGQNSDLLDADTNLKYGLKYLKGAYIVADGDWDNSIKWYARGYYYEAKRKGLLYETGLRTR